MVGKINFIFQARIVTYIINLKREIFKNCYRLINAKGETAAFKTGKIFDCFYILGKLS
jgi:hypothetical protein